MLRARRTQVTLPGFPRNDLEVIGRGFGVYTPAGILMTRVLRSGRVRGAAILKHDSAPIRLSKERKYTAWYSTGEQISSFRKWGGFFPVQMTDFQEGIGTFLSGIGFFLGIGKEAKTAGNTT